MSLNSRHTSEQRFFGLGCRETLNKTVKESLPEQSAAGVRGQLGHAAGAPPQVRFDLHSLQQQRRPAHRAAQSADHFGVGPVGGLHLQHHCVGGGGGPREVALDGIGGDQNQFSAGGLCGSGGGGGDGGAAATEI